MVQELGFSVKLNLVGKFTETEAYIWDTKVPTSHSAKNDVYLWAIEKYIKTNLVNPYYLSAYDDGWIGANQYTPPLYYNENDELAFEPGEPGMPPYFKYQIYRKDVTNKDYFVSKKAFFFDLLFVESAGPVDDKNQPYGTDYATLCKILKETNERAGDTIIRVGGFTNYHTKYSLIWDLNLERGGTVEGQWGYLLTKYNAGMMADAAAISSMANASVHMNYKLPVMTQSENVNRLKQASESVKLENKNYICFQIGDFDGSTWTNNLLPLLWDDPNRGKVPIMWPISPINVERIPQVYDIDRKSVV